MTKYLPKIIGTLINFISLFSAKMAAKIAVYVFSKPKKGQLSKTEQTFLNTSKQELVNYKGISIMTYKWEGKKDTILLAHGWESNTHRWKELIEILTHLNHTVIALDAPAHGNSGHNTFNAVLYSECIGVVAKQFKVNSIVGHSIGGTAGAISLHNNNLPLIKKIITLGAPSNLAGLVNNYVKMMGFNTSVLNAMNNYYLKYFGHLPKHFTVSVFLKNVTAKGLIIHDKKDKIISYSDALDFYKHFKDSKLIKTVGLGHRLKSDDVNTHIVNFLNA